MSGLLQGIEVVSWDVDGTLYELPAMKSRLRRLALRRGLLHPLRVARELSRLIGMKRAMERVREAGGDLRRLALPERVQLAALEERWYVEAIRDVGPRPGVVALLDELRGRGLRLIVVSDHPAEEKLAALGLGVRFEQVFCGEGVGFLKPSPRPFEVALAELGIEPGALLHVGDRSDTDAVAAAAAGCRSLILPPGPIDPDLFAD